MVRAEKRGGKLAAPPDILAGRDLRTLWSRQETGEIGNKRTVSEYDGPKEGRATHRAQALAAAAIRYAPTQTLTRRKPQEETGAALHRRLGLGAMQHPGKTKIARKVTRLQRKSAEGRGGLSGLKSSERTPSAAPAALPPLVVQATPDLDTGVVVDLTESLLASQSDLGPYWGRGLSRKTDRTVLVDLAMEGDTSEGESTVDRSIPQVDPEDNGYDSFDSEDMNNGFRRYKERNLAAWLGTRIPWEGWTHEAIHTMIDGAYMIDLYSWLPGRRRWGDSRRGPGRT